MRANPEWGSWSLL